MPSPLVRRAILACSAGSLLVLALQPITAGARANMARSSIMVPHTSKASAEVPGTQLWVARYNGPATRENAARAMRVSPDGSRVFVTGASNGGPPSYFDYATIAYDASTGRKLWVARYNGPGNGDDYPNALGVSPDGSRVFVTGESTGPTGGLDYATVAYDASTGATLWVKRYNVQGIGDDVAYALGVSPDGSTVFVTGGSTGSTDGIDYATIAYDASTGRELWLARYNGPGNGNDYPHALAVSPDGSTVFVTGSSTGSAGYLGYATVAYVASTGAALWVSRYKGPGSRDDYATALGVSPGGSRVFVTGASAGRDRGCRYGTCLDYATVAYDASSGNQLWVKRYNGQANIDDEAHALGVSPDGSTVFVTGESPGITSDDYATVAYDVSTGTRLWVSRYHGPGNSSAAYALGVSPDGSEVFVTGGSAGSVGPLDYATVAYDSSAGRKLWAMRYHGPGRDGQGDVADALGVSPDGSKVFVTGGSERIDGSHDYATIAYSTS